MNLREARLCLDCEELHDKAECPKCLSESFAYVTRWLPSADRKPTLGRTTSAGATSGGTTSSSAGKWIARGAAGVALLALGRLLRPEPPGSPPGGPGKTGPDREGTGD